MGSGGAIAALEPGNKRGLGETKEPETERSGDVGLFDNLERGLEKAVKGPFAKVFKAEVQPVEIASHIRGSMDDRAAVLGPGRTMVPNVFTIELASDDFERLASYDKALTDELIAAAEDHADAQRYTAPGQFEVRLVKSEQLETGIFRVLPASKDGRNQPGRQTSARQPSQDASSQARPANRQAPPPVPGDDDGATRAFPAATAAPRKSAAQTRGTRAYLDIDGKKQPLGTAVTTIGRDESAMVMVDDPGISRRHAEIRITHDGPNLLVLIRDAGSTNGTYLNGDQIGTEELQEGDRITLGRTTMTFHLEQAR